MNILNGIRNLPFYLWAVGGMFPIMGNKRRIDRYRREGEYEKEREEIRLAQNYWGSSGLRALRGTLAVEHLDRIPEGPVLFVSNHQGNADIIVFMAAVTMKQHGFVAKQELSKIPYFGAWIKRIRSLMLEREDSRAAVRTFKEGEEWLRQGFSLVIFPEGTRSRGNEMAPFKKGSLHLATRARVPIVPVSLYGSWHLFEEKGHLQPWTVRFFVHEPIVTEGLSKEALAELPARVEHIIREKVDEWNREGATVNGIL
jgi:1-acyl-sn-glycerol-3-phosphate acyltransferase